MAGFGKTRILVASSISDILEFSTPVVIVEWLLSDMSHMNHLNSGQYFLARCFFLL